MPLGDPPLNIGPPCHVSTNVYDSLNSPHSQKACIQHILSSHNTSQSDLHSILGPLMVGGGGLDVACQFQEMPMSHVSVAFYRPCHMSNLRYNCLSLIFLLLPPCPILLRHLSHMSIFKKAHVAMSNLRVKGHWLILPDGRNSPVSLNCHHLPPSLCTLVLSLPERDPYKFNLCYVGTCTAQLVGKYICMVSFRAAGWSVWFLRR